MRLVIDAPDDLPGVVADMDQLQQVLINLLNNACKFTDQGVVRLRARREPGGGVRVTVGDSGVGIPPTECDNIFDKFYQVATADTLKDKPKGTGLGLAICRHIIEHYEGRIWAESQLGRGSDFHVWLPPQMLVEAPRVSWAAESGASDQAAESRGGRKRILVVDDDPSLCAYIAGLLEQEEYETATASNGVEAIELARSFKPDLITMDIMLPVLDGKTAIAALREDPKLAAAPIVVISALPEDQTRIGDANFCKPIQEEQLLWTVRMLLDASRNDCDCSVLFRDATDFRAANRLLLCPGGVRSASPDELWDLIRQGQFGTVIVPPGLCAEIDLDRLASEGNVHVVILPKG